MRTVTEELQRSDGHDLSLLDGIKVFYKGGWAQILPDADEALFHIYAEGVDADASEQMAESFVEQGPRGDRRQDRLGAPRSRASLSGDDESLAGTRRAAKPRRLSATVAGARRVARHERRRTPASANAGDGSIKARARSPMSVGATSETDADAETQSCATPATVERRGRAATPPGASSPAVVGVLVAGVAGRLRRAAGLPSRARAVRRVGGRREPVASDAGPGPRRPRASDSPRRGLDTIVLQSGQGPLDAALADLGLTVDLAATARRAARRGRLACSGLRPVVRRRRRRRAGRALRRRRLSGRLAEDRAGLRQARRATPRSPWSATPSACGPRRPGLAIDAAALKSDVLAAPRALAALSGCGAAHGLAAGGRHGGGPGRVDAGRRLPEQPAAAALPPARDRPEPRADGEHAVGHARRRRRRRPADLRQPPGSQGPAPSLRVRRDAGRERDGRGEGQEGVHQAEQRGLWPRHAAASVRHGLHGVASPVCARWSCP